MLEKCFQVACAGKELTAWDNFMMYVMFFGPIAIILIIMISLLIWLAKKG